MENIAHSFSATLSERLGDTTLADVQPNSPVQIKVVAPNGTEVPILSGYIDARTRSITGGATVYKINGRSKTGDLVDCSAFTDKTTWKNITYPDLCRRIVEPFDIDVVQVIDDGKKLPNYTVKPTSTAFSTIEELGRQHDSLPLTNEEGNLVLEYATPGLRSEVDLFQGAGGNVLEISEDYNMRERFSEYIIKGQGTSAGGKPWEPEQTTQLKGIAKDQYVPRYRPKVSMAGSKITASEIQKRALWEAQVRSGRSLGYNVKVKGWLQGLSSVPWQINTLVNLTVKPWNINSIFLVTARSFNINNQDGRTTSITLRYQSTYSSNPTGGIDV